MDLAFSEMAARSELSPARWRRPFLIWLDGIEAGWAIPLLLIGFIAVWLAFLMIAYQGGDLHSDVLETWTLGRSLEAPRDGTQGQRRIHGPSVQNASPGQPSLWRRRGRLVGETGH